MKQTVNEKELLEYFACHTFEDKKDNLSAIKKRLGISEETVRKASMLRKKKLCYALSGASLLLSLILYFGCRTFLFSDTARTYFAAKQDYLQIFNNMQHPFVIQGMTAICILLLIAALSFFIAGVFLEKKQKK